ncbi:MULTISPECIES: hypothetical protein [unclassified Agrobacterium]|uniref:hypothetical protein n=1 Tax=unclassified Agrobacterium TaxID=2632611 RepID=UPI000372A4C2|nr:MULTISPECIES: hypothetical protein [unclassified Agrobacterium]SNB78021.1 hypothetical protein SAMN05661103_4398 [Agrobacterium sp. 719_389]
MFDEKNIQYFLGERGIIAAGRIAKDAFKANRFVVFVDVTRDKENRQVPSNKLLNDIREQILKEGVTIEFVLTDATQQDIEAGYRASILHSFGEFVRNAFLTIDGKNVVAWIAPKVKIQTDVLPKIEDRTKLFLSNYELELSALEFTSDANLPGKFACLQVARLKSPFTVADLTQALLQKGFTIPSENWTTRILDNLRKSGFVIRQKSGRYVVTLSGLKALGTQKNRRSPDIGRVLALARSQG